MLFGGAGNDVLRGGEGDDEIYGRDGDNVIVFEARGDNMIDLAALNLSSFGALNITQQGSDVVVNTGVGTITLWNVAVADTAADDFVF